MLYPEHTLCKAFYSTVRRMKEFNLVEQKFILFHVANENKSGKTQGGLNKSIGVMSGVFDYMLFWEGNVAMLEAKAKKGEYGAKADGVLSDNQKSFMKSCKEINIPCFVFYTVNEGLEILVNLGLIKKGIL